MTEITSSGTATSSNWDVNASAMYNSGLISFSSELFFNDVNTGSKGIHPELYFKYVKKKFKTLERMRLDSRLKKLEKAFMVAVENGQNFLAAKFLAQVAAQTRESVMYSKGVKFFIERQDLNKYKHQIRGGHISDTKFEDFTRVIPKNVLKRKKELDGVFDSYVIYHYWNDEAEKARAKNQKMSDEEKGKMRDPVLFGMIKETNRLYFIIDWVDDKCDLTFDEIVDELDKKEDEIKLTREVKPFKYVKNSGS